MKENNNPEQEKSQWNRPVLTVLVRNNPEETVLTACKMRHVVAGPGNFAGGRANQSGPYCYSCANLSSS